MSLTKAAIERNRVTTVLLLVVAIAGLNAWFNLPQAEDPGFTIRIALVITYFPGASPERVEQLVTDKLEKGIQEMPELDFLQSESKPGVSVIFVNIQQRYKEMRPIWDKLRRKVEKVTPDLPEGIIGPIINETFAKAYARGVPIVFGTDTGVSAHGDNAVEFALMVEGGMPPMEAIQSATSVAAEFLDIGDTHGRLLEGYQADIVAVPGNPLDDITLMQQVSFVMKGGVRYK